MLSSDELATIQATATASLDLTCTVQRATTSDDGYGHAVATWATIATVAAGMAKPSAQVMQEYAGKIGARATWIVSLPLGTSIQPDDRLTLDSTTVRVEADLTQGSYSTLTQVLTTEVRP